MRKHHDFDRKKWASMDLFNQMGNIGSEVGRSVNALATGRSQDAEAALYRGLDLIDATLNAPAMHGYPRKQELARTREQFVQVYTENDQQLGRVLENYFMQFAIVARIRQFK